MSMTPAELQELKARCLDLARSICDPTLEPETVAMLAENLERDVLKVRADAEALAAKHRA